MPKVNSPYGEDRGHTPLDQEFLSACRDVADNWTKYANMDDVDSLIGLLLDELEYRADLLDACMEEKHSIIQAACDDVDSPHYIPQSESL